MIKSCRFAVIVSLELSTAVGVRRSFFVESETPGTSVLTKLQEFFFRETEVIRFKRKRKETNLAKKHRTEKLLAEIYVKQAL